MPTASITWHTSHDDRVCPICKDIDGYTWIFEGVVPDSLEHPKWGEVWNKQLGSLAHEHQLHKGSKYGLLSNCRCKIECHVSAKDLLEKLKKLREDVKTAQGTEATP